ncbi:M23 family peptidase [Campylobacter novaezeelandiae]|uniref:M23 family peptidase n=1 Tax=Campylobacter novaezeelandiae TaxID=2267891 RepID=A0A4Q9JUR2_9BACT|nr:M23 family metallopeptidase [Campylobacter novaezeelandiae]QWU79511.1 zinc metallopeptidase, M23 family [Campylobacter novaezeelandiae]TBR78710.1 M23 family peptidase [Campylobacter novaezeelandiae]TBR80190.1 M23 family peptidase [Campylobacter novaezeelandiae]
MAQKRGKRKNFLFILILVFIALFGYFLNNLSIFEKNKPEIFVNDIVYSNLKNPILIRVKDDESGLKNIKITLKKDSNDPGIILMDQKVNQKNDITLEINLPKLAYKEKIKSYIMEIEAHDASFWNFFSGNYIQKSVFIDIDDANPKLKVLSNSYQIEQGGVASVVFKVEDKNLDQVYIQTDKGKIFKATPYIKDGYYASLIAWDAKDDYFRAYIIATDKAGNTTKERIRYYFVNRKYRVSNINLSDKFLDTKIKFLASAHMSEEDASKLNKTQKFKFVNETLRLANENLIHKITSEVPEESIEDFNLNLFLPLKNAMKVADFADHRFYFYNGEFVSSGYHMGLDLASTAFAPIISSNSGKVVFAEDNGIYGLNIIIYHGFGVYSLYGHCSSKNVDVNENVKQQDIIANTGSSGLALGDHLHFEVLVQGVETRPEQWQDKIWLKNNIYKVLEDGKKMILSEK